MMKICVAGQGAFGQKHLDALKRIPDVEVTSLVGGNQDATAEVAKKYGIPHFTGDLGEGIKRADAVILDHPDADALSPRRASHARRQARADRNSDRRQRGGLGAAGCDREGNRRYRHGGPRAPVQSQPSMDPQSDHEGRAQGPADGRADLLLPSHQHERSRQAAQLDRSPALASRCPHRRPVPISGRRDCFGLLRRAGPGPSDSSASRWTWAS